MPLRAARRAWLQQAGADGASMRAIGEQLGYSHTTILRWVRDGIPPEKVISIARATGQDVTEALAAVGWLSLEDLEVLERMPTAVLTAELHRRAICGTFDVPDGPQ